MSLNSEEIILVSKQLRENLLSNNYTWLIQQFDEEVSRGKITLKKAKDLEFRFLDNRTDIKKIKADNFVVSEPYSESEKLQLLLDSILHIKELNDMENSIIDFFNIQISNLRSIEFIDERTEKSELKIDRDKIENNRELISNLSNYIKELKESI